MSLLKKTICILLLFGFVIGFSGASFAGDPYSHQIKTLRFAPDPDARVVYNLPIEVKMLDVSEDANWYKVRISFYLGPINFVYSGWTYIPVGQILTERYENSKIALSSE